MVASFHYDESVYHQLLCDTLPDDQERTVMTHVEFCEDCQSKLESLSQTEFTWDDVRRYLSPHDNDVDSPNSRVQSDAFSDDDSVASLQFLEASEDEDSIGRFGRYEIREVLGRGGMGIVMRGYDPALGRHSAIKVLAPEMSANAAARDRFSREAKSAAAVVHEHVVPIQTVDEQKNVPYFVMPVVEGRSLQQRVDQRGPLEVKEVLRIGMQTALGLSAAHAQGLVHRDVKPANILLENGVERVLITDFGLARAADDASMTRSGVIAGTPQYMSPEQARGTHIDSRSDLFSLGSVLYFMCCGHSPFRAETTMGVLHRIVNDDPRPVRSINPEVPHWLESIIEKLLKKEADHRYQSADDVARLLGRWLSHLQQPESEPPPQPVASVKSLPACIRGWLAAAFGVMACIAAAGTIIVELNKGTLTIRSPLPGVPIRISRNDKVVDRMIVKQGLNTTRIAAGEYVVEIDGPTEDLLIEDNKVSLKPRGNDAIVITRTSDSASVPGDTLSPDDDQKRGSNETDFDAKQFGKTVQVVFNGPEGLLVQTMKHHEPGPMALTLDNAYEDHGPCPSRWDLTTSSHAYRRLLLTGIPGREEVRFQPILLLRPANRATESWLRHNAIPIDFTNEDFDQVLSGNRVTKVVYYPDPEFAKRAIARAETLVSTRMDPGVNPIQEAGRRGSILAVLQIEDYDKHQTARYEGMPLEEAVRNLNGQLRRRPHLPAQPPLTVAEVVAWARWNLSFMKGDRYKQYRAPYQRIVDHGVMPDGGAFLGDVVRHTEGELSVDTFQIGMNHVLPLNAIDGDVQIYVRRRHIKSKQETDSIFTPADGRPLSSAIAEFNEFCKGKDPDQVPLTEEEVVAALRNLLFKNWIDRPGEMSQTLVANIGTITNDRVLPDDSEFVLKTDFKSADGNRFRIWRPSIRVAAGDSDARTFPLRTHFLSSE